MKDKFKNDFINVLSYNAYCFLFNHFYFRKKWLHIKQALATVSVHHKNQIMFDNRSNTCYLYSMFNVEPNFIYIELKRYLCHKNKLQWCLGHKTQAATVFLFNCKQYF